VTGRENDAGYKGVSTSGLAPHTGVASPLLNAPVFHRQYLALGRLGRSLLRGLGGQPRTAGQILELGVRVPI